MHGPDISWDIEVGSEITQCERVEVQPIAKRQRQCEDLRLGSVEVGGWVSARVRVGATAVVLWSNDHDFNSNVDSNSTRNLNPNSNPKHHPDLNPMHNRRVCSAKERCVPWNLGTTKARIRVRVGVKVRPGLGTATGWRSRDPNPNPNLGTATRWRSHLNSML